MTVIVGPSDWWIASPTSIDSLVISCPVGTTLPDGSRVICKAGGTVWIVAPNCTQVSSQWAGGQYNTTQVGSKCCICEWPGLNTQLINRGFNPCDWFVPNISQLNNPGYVCRAQWDTYISTIYYSSTEVSSTTASALNFSGGAIGSVVSGWFVDRYGTRAIRIVLQCLQIFKISSFPGFFFSCYEFHGKLPYILRILCQGYLWNN